MASAPWPPWRAFVVGLVLSLGVGYAIRPRATDPGRLAAPSIPAADADALIPDVTPSRDAASRATVPVARVGEELALDRAAFPASGPVRVSLELPVPSADDEPRPVRLVSQPDHRILEISGAVGGDRSAAAIAVDRGYLQPGEYLVEVKTTERSALPFRRYVIVVR